MSAYALPGLFPPIVSPSEAADVRTSSAGSSMDASETRPLHETEDSTTFGTMLKASVDRFYSPLLGSESQKKEQCGAPGISVKDAKIDPVRLVQCVTQGQKTTKSKNNNNKLSKHQSYRERSRESSKHFTTSSSLGSPKTTAKASVRSPHDEAISFELSITFNGRKYTAMRTMQCILQFRDDLINEMNARKAWLQLKRSSQQDTTADSAQMKSNEDCDHNIDIPEIPPMNGDEGGTVGGGSFVGRGFTLLHAMATSYVPTVERWFHNVMAIVPQDSECLMNFLWEPLPNDLPPVELKACASLATLGSIKELEYNTDDSDSDDEWEG